MTDEPATSVSPDDAGAPSALTDSGSSGEPKVKRPKIEKAKADQTFTIPEGHHRGEEMTFGQRVVLRITWLLSVTIAKLYFRAKVRSRENVPKTGSFILSPVHRSNLDSPMLALVTRRRVRYMGKESLWKSRFGAWYFTAAGGFPVERASADRVALQACLDCIERGEPLVLFPEGTRQTGPTVTDMFDGPAWLAARGQVPILPIGIGGSERAMGKGMKFPRPSRMTLVIGKPIYPPKPNAKGRVPRPEVRALTVDLRDSLQQLFDEAQEIAGTPNKA